MLTIEDEPTIRFAIERRLKNERGINCLEVLVMDHKPTPEDPGCIAVGVHVLIDRDLQARSRFDLPREFEHVALINQIDEICEQYKAARVQHWGKGRVIGKTEVQLAGTGTRGAWRKH